MNDTSVGAFFVGLLMGAIAVAIIAVVATWNQVPQKEIVKHGAAYWQVNDDGSTTFKWKEEVKS